MAENEAQSDIVAVAGRAPALSRPEFIIAVDGKYYLTVAVWEYSTDAAGTDEQKAGVAQINEQFRFLRNNGWERVAVQLPSHPVRHDHSMQHTWPPV